MNVEYHPLLGSDLSAARDFYNDRSPGLGDQFVDEFETQVLRIAARPERWMIVRDDVRRALMRRFPYTVFFRILNEDRIRVTVIKHQRQHPGFGMGRD